MQEHVDLNVKRDAMLAAMREYNEARAEAAALGQVPHLHVSSSSRDCDGRLDSEHVSTEEFMFAVQWAVGVYDEGTRIHTWKSGDLWNAEVNNDTEEGFHNVTITECNDDCDLGAHSRRDHEAEKAGY